MIAYILHEMHKDARNKTIKSSSIFNKPEAIKEGHVAHVQNGKTKEVTMR